MLNNIFQTIADLHHTPFFYFFVVLLGSIFGNFASFIAHRICSSEKEIFSKDAQCHNCGKVLSFWDTFPLIGMIKNKIKCSKCKKIIPIRYLLTEVFCSVGFLTSYITFDFGIKTFLFCAIIFCAAIHIATDLEYGHSSDIITIALFFLSFAIMATNQISLFAIVSKSILAALITSLIAYLTFTLAKKSPISIGDLKIIIAIGPLFNSFQDLMIFSVVIGFGGLISSFAWKKIYDEDYFPFAPSLMIGIVCVFISNKFLVL